MFQRTGGPFTFPVPLPYSPFSLHGAGVTLVDPLAAAGFDLAQPFDAHAVGAALALRALTGAGRLGWLIGNTRALWPVFTAAMRDRPRTPNPLDRYLEDTLAAIAPAPARVLLGHRRDAAGGFVPLQRIAVASGLGALAPSHLVIHPVYGPWIALRAVVIVDGEPPPLPGPIAAPCRCEAACARTLERALAGTGDWLAVREACALRDHRYSDDQIRYHYTKIQPDTW
jgi:hypothetical protein